jgi:hypothetical protein
MYGLPQAGKVASDCLLPRLAAAGYTERAVTPGLFKHATSSIIFALVVDGSLVQYSTYEDSAHLPDTFCQYYQTTGMTLEWKYADAAL